MANAKSFGGPVVAGPVGFRHAYSMPYRVVSGVGGVSRTKQSFRDECDVNQIMKRYQMTGILPGQDRMAMARYLDCTEVDFQKAMLTVASAKQAFDALPAVVRERFANDPARLLAFLDDPENRAEAVKLGLVDESKGGGSTPPVDNSATGTVAGSGTGSRVPGAPGSGVST